MADVSIVTQVRGVGGSGVQGRGGSISTNNNIKRESVAEVNSHFGHVSRHDVTFHTFYVDSLLYCDPIVLVSHGRNIECWDTS